MKSIIILIAVLVGMSVASGLDTSALDADGIEYLVINNTSIAVKVPSDFSINGTALAALALAKEYRATKETNVSSLSGEDQAIVIMMFAENTSIGIPLTREALMYLSLPGKTRAHAEGYISAFMSTTPD